MLFSDFGEATVQLGASGQDVKTLQHLLRLNGHGDLVEDGRFGSATQQALMNFQMSHSLKADGIAGPATWAALFAAVDAQTTYVDVSTGASSPASSPSKTSADRSAPGVSPVAYGPGGAAPSAGKGVSAAGMLGNVPLLLGAGLAAYVFFGRKR